MENPMQTIHPTVCNSAGLKQLLLTVESYECVYTMHMVRSIWWNMAFHIIQVYETCVYLMASQFLRTFFQQQLMFMLYAIRKLVFHSIVSFRYVFFRHILLPIRVSYLVHIHVLLLTSILILLHFCSQQLYGGMLTKVVFGNLA